MAVVSSLSCNLQLTPRINWTTGQEKSIVKEYPFTDLAHETPDQYVVRTYLQFLWLPESIMPLKMLIASLKRVNIASVSSHPEEPRPHPLHDLLDPLLHTPRSAAQKYHMELPKILGNGGGAGEIEETMMWYVLSYEKGNQEDDVVGGTSNVIGVWEDDKWRSNWLQRMERREVQIQILLYFLLLSLPGPTPLPPPPPEISSVKRRKQIRKKAIPIPSIEDRLEAFMDKLSTWQLMVDLNSSPIKDKIDDELDWMQAFSRDVVDQQFRPLLPEQCDLLRCKVFHQSPFTDDENEETQTLRSSSPDPRPIKRLRTTSSTAAPQPGAPNSRYPSPAPSSTSSRIDPKRKSSSKNSEPRKLERSRSLSLSLAEEAEERRRAASNGPSRRLLTREVSMNRSFKNAAKAQQANAESSQSLSTAVKSIVRPIKSETKDQGLTLVEATPVKPRETRVRGLTRAPSQILVPDSPTKPVGGLMRSLSHASTMEEEEWQFSGNISPAVLYLPGEHDSDDELNLGSTNGSVLDTPAKSVKEA